MTTMNQTAACDLPKVIEQSGRVSSAPKLITCLILVAGVSACSNSKLVETRDNSADYRSAQSLPPLKKPSAVAVKAKPVQAEAILEVQAIQSEPIQAKQVSELSDDPSLESKANDISAEVADSSLVDQIQQPTASEPSVDTLVPPFVESDSPNVSSSASDVATSLIEDKSGQARLKLDADIDQSWAYLSSALQSSDLTVFSRNRTAGRFSIGCAGIDAAPTVRKSGRWSFFTRDNQQRTEYCTLYAVEKRGATIVSVLNRSGNEVSAEYSKDIFARLMN